MAAFITTLPITMLIQQNFLRIVRKRTLLTQADIAAIFNIRDLANVSRWEQGQRTPNVQMLLGYHLLFNVPAEELFDRQKQELKRIIVPSIRDRIAHLKTLEPDPKLHSRIEFLECALNRLTKNSHGE